MHCALHPTESSNITCRRCGDAACAACIGQSGQAAHCLACQKWSIERRLELIGVERMVRALGIAIACMSVGMLVLCLGVFIAAAADPKMRVPLLVTWSPVAPVSVAFLVYGIALARARTGLRWPAVIASLGMLPVLPVGTLMGLASLVALATQSVRKVFSKEHRSIIESTAGVRLGSPFALLAVGAAVVWPVAALFGFVVVYNLVAGRPG